MFVHVADAASVGRELCEHEFRFVCIGADLTEGATLKIEHPVVTTCLHAPDLLRIGEDEELRSIVGPVVIVDGQ